MDREEKELGKITHFRLGEIDGRFGFWVDIKGQGWGIGDYRSFVHSGADRAWLTGLLTAAKVRYMDELVGKPVEVLTTNGTLKSWRLLTEVL